MLKSPTRQIILILSEWGFTWKGLKDNRSGEWWLIAQISLIAVHLLPPYISLNLKIINTSIPSKGLYIIIIGFFLAIIAFASLGDNLSPLPEPKKGANLVIIRSYKYCRHPIYQAILVCSLGTVIYLDSVIHLILFVLLSLVLRGKALREEEKLLKIHSEYNRYRKITPALIPRIPLLDWR